MGIKRLTASCLYNHDSAYPSVCSHPDFGYLRDMVAVIRANRSNYEELNSAIQSMKRVLSRMFSVKFNLTLVDNGQSNKMFVANIFPEMDVCRKIVNLILDEDRNNIDIIRDAWAEIDELHMDLDSRLFFDTSSEFDDIEIAALLIYKIESVLMTFDVVNGVNYIVRKNFNLQSYANNKIARSNVCRKLFILPFFTACTWTNFAFNNPIAEGSCITTDSELNSVYISAVRKLIAFDGNDLVDADRSTLMVELQGVCDWIFACVSDMKYSTRMLKSTLKKLLMVQQSYYVKNVLIDILNDFGARDLDDAKLLDGTQHVLESYTGRSGKRIVYNPKAMETRQKMREHAVQQRIDKVVAVAESFADLFDSMGFMKKVTQRDIDVLRVSAQKIRSADDKLYVLDDLHDYLDIVEGSLAVLNSSDSNKARKVRMSKETLKDFEAQLNSIREAIINKHVGRGGNPEPSSVFITYPAGYEG